MFILDLFNNRILYASQSSIALYLFTARPCIRVGICGHMCIKIIWLKYTLPEHWFNFWYYASPYFKHNSLLICFGNTLSLLICLILLISLFISFIYVFFVLLLLKYPLMFFFLYKSQLVTPNANLKVNSISCSQLIFNL